MKKILTACLIMIAMATLQSCKSCKVAAQPAEQKINAPFAGTEWEIIEINGESVVPGDKRPFPYIGFRADEDYFYGNSGCNNMMGRYTLGKKAGSLSFSQAAGTLMYCEGSMETERDVLNILGEIKSYKKTSDEEILLFGKNKKNPIAVLKHKIKLTDIADIISSKWIVSKFYTDKEIEVDSKKMPNITLDAKQRKAFGFAGCNRLVSSVNIDLNNKEIAFGKIGLTRMFCEDMEIERLFINNLEKVAAFSFDQVTEVLTFLDADHNPLLDLYHVND